MAQIWNRYQKPEGDGDKVPALINERMTNTNDAKQGIGIYDGYQTNGLNTPTYLEFWHSGWLPSHETNNSDQQFHSPGKQTCVNNLNKTEALPYTYQSSPPLILPSFSAISLSAHPVPLPSPATCTVRLSRESHLILLSTTK